MHRMLEPEIMADVEQSLAYASADFASSNQLFADHLLTGHPQSLHNVIDIGCGPCDVMLRLAGARPDIHITVVDGSVAMIELATQAVRAAGHEARIVAMQDISLVWHCVSMPSMRSSQKTFCTTCLTNGPVE